MIAGVDEAGRGPVIGPLVVATVLAKSQHGMARLGVKDSKQLSPAKREELAPRIHEKAHAVEIRVISSQELDRRMPHQTLNDIEVEAFGELLGRVKPREAIIDACDVDAARFGRLVAARIGPAPEVALVANTAKRAIHALAQHDEGPCTVRSEHGADARHAIVAAASIIAKVERDRLVSELEAEYGVIGSGYASDPKTKAFMASYFEAHGVIPPCARKFWETSRRLVPVNRTLGDF